MEQIYIKDEPIAEPSSEQDCSDVLCTKFEDTAPESSTDSQFFSEAARMDSEVSPFFWTEAKECLLIDAVKKYPVLWHPRKSTLKDLPQDEKNAITGVTYVINKFHAGASPQSVLHHWAGIYYNALQAHAAGSWVDFKHAQRMNFCFPEIKLESPCPTDIITTGAPKEHGRKEKNGSAPHRTRGRRKRRPPSHDFSLAKLSKAEHIPRLSRLISPMTDKVSGASKFSVAQSISAVTQYRHSTEGRSSKSLRGKSSLANTKCQISVKADQNASIYLCVKPFLSHAGPVGQPQILPSNSSRAVSGTPARIPFVLSEELLCEVDPLPHSCFTPDFNVVVASPPHKTSSLQEPSPPPETNSSQKPLNSRPDLNWLKLREQPGIVHAMSFEPVDVGFSIDTPCSEEFDEIRALMLFMSDNIWHTMARETNRCYAQHCQMLNAACKKPTASGLPSAANQTPTSDAASHFAGDSCSSGSSNFATPGTPGQPPLKKPRRKRDGPEPFVSPPEIWAYVGILLLLGVDPPPALEFRWDLNSHMRSEIIDSAMPLERFQHINTFFRLVNCEDLPARDSPHYLTARVAPLLTPLQEKSASVYKASSQNLSIDESSLDWRVNSALRQHDSSKSHNYEIKAYKLVESSTGYLSGIFLNDNTDHSEENIVLNLLNSSPYKPDEGYSLFLGQSLSTPDLLWHLRKELRFNVNGSCDQNHHNFPSFLANPRCSAKAALAADGKTSILGIKFGGAFLFSTEYAANTQGRSSEHSQPTLAVAYSKHSVGVTKNDAMVAQYSPCKITSKLWHKLILYLLSTAVTNAWIVYNKLCPGTYEGASGHLAFRCELGLHMISLFKPRKGALSKSLSLATLSLVRSQHHLPAVLPPIVKTDKKRQLRLRCRRGGCRSHSSIYCVKCEVPFCLKYKSNCFIKYHEQLERAGGDDDLGQEDDEHEDSGTDTADSDDDENNDVGLPAKGRRSSDHLE